MLALKNRLFFFLQNQKRHKKQKTKSVSTPKNHPNDCGFLRSVVFRHNCHPGFWRSTQQGCTHLVHVLCWKTTIRICSDFFHALHILNAFLDCGTLSFGQPGAIDFCRIFVCKQIQLPSPMIVGSSQKHRRNRGPIPVAQVFVGTTGVKTPRLG